MLKVLHHEKITGLEKSEILYHNITRGIKQLDFDCNSLKDRQNQDLQSKTLYKDFHKVEFFPPLLNVVIGTVRIH